MQNAQTLMPDPILPFGDGDMRDLTTPSAYSGLYAFHKYWGKKPVEPLRALISLLSSEGDIIADPFLGSGAIAKEAFDLGRRFVGSDINPIAVRLTNFNLAPCSRGAYKAAFDELETELAAEINESYVVEPHGLTSHLLWNQGEIESVWQRPQSGKKRRLERAAEAVDYKRAAEFDHYSPRLLRDLDTFQNSRINSKPGLGWNDLFCGRALRNIELLLEKIRTFPTPVRDALELTLTASIGQMSRMVFAITSRGKSTGTSTGKTEVGSWVIGFWRPQQHFEINVWNCFESRAQKLLKALPEFESLRPNANNASDVLANNKSVFIEKNGANCLLDSLPDNSIQLIITDPPHGDRIPYLELSEIWNAVINENCDLSQEVIVSNAKGRDKVISTYNFELSKILNDCADKLVEGGFAVLLFNSRHQREWKALEALQNANNMTFLGAMPMNYSARSVVQDNRKGAMKHDYIVVFGKGMSSFDSIQQLKSVPGWQSSLPMEK